MFPVPRFIEILCAFAGYAAWLWAARMHVIRPRETPGRRLRQTLERLGGAFVKLGQAMSLRRDILPESWLADLEGLQDRVPPFCGAAAREEAERALGEHFVTQLARFENEPLAAASVAQVHRAEFRDGRKAIVKVRRPGIKEQMGRDLAILRVVLQILALVLPRLRQFDPQALLAELAANLRRELDFRHEALRIRQFGAVFEGSTSVYIPAVIDDFAAESALVQVESGGLRIDDPGIHSRGPMLARNFVGAYLEQFFGAGVFHADPHPGNLFVMADGRICFHDFGLVGSLDQGTRRGLAAFMQAFVYQDPDWLMDAYLQMGIFGADLDRRHVREGLRAVLDDYARLPLKDWSFAEAFVRVFRLAGPGMRLPHELLMLMRAFFLIETTVRTLDPDFNLVDGLLARAPEVAWQAARNERREAQLARLRFEALAFYEDVPNLLIGLIRRLRDLLDSPGDGR